MRHLAIQPSAAPLSSKPVESVLARVPGFYAQAIADFPELDWINKWPLAKRENIWHSERYEFARPDAVKPKIKSEGICKIENVGLAKGRIIQAYYNEISCSHFAPRFYCMQKAVCNAFSGDFTYRGVHYHVQSACGWNHADIGSWVAALPPGVLFYERDGKSWDSTMQKTHFDLQLEFFASDPELSAYIRSCTTTTGKARGEGVSKITYTAVYTRKSGHNDTTSGNTTINIVITVNAVDRLTRRPIAVYGLFLGDDLILALEYPEPAGKGAWEKGVGLELQSNEAALGIKPEYAIFSSIYDISFISGQWFPLVGGGWGFGPKIGRLMAKLFWTVSQQAVLDMAAWRSSVAESFLDVYGDCPILGIFLRRQITTERRVKHGKFINNLCYGQAGDWSMYLAIKYRLSLSDIESAEDYLLKLPRSCVFCEHPVIDMILAVDLADPCDRPLSLN